MSARQTESSNAEVLFAYPNISLVSEDSTEELPDAWLIGRSASPQLQVIKADPNAEPLWTCTTPRYKRDKGFLLDDCSISGGTLVSTGAPTVINVAGTIRGRGYHNYFGPLLRLS